MLHIVGVVNGKSETKRDDETGIFLSVGNSRLFYLLKYKNEISNQ